ncbi:hypothetical protein [Paraburkholderia caribensis]|nr:hypothetical protein [Paraburkholderia caribensis]
MTIGRGALANPDLPKVFESGREPKKFDASILHLVASIKKKELGMQTSA